MFLPVFKILIKSLLCVYNTFTHCIMFTSILIRFFHDIINIFFCIFFKFVNSSTCKSPSSQTDSIVYVQANSTLDKVVDKAKNNIICFVTDKDSNINARTIYQSLEIVYSLSIQNIISTAYF